MAEESQAEPEKVPDSKKRRPTYKHPLAQFALATSYITIIPLSRFIKIEGEPAVLGDEEILAGLAKYLPTVGALIGLPLCVMALLLGLGESTANKSLLNAVILAIAWLVITGGLHFDGLMDTADGIFSHRSKERMLEIMQDSRVGNFGAISGICTFVLKVAAMAAMSPQALPLALFLTPMWARFAEVYAIAHYPYARPQGKGKVWHDTTKVPRDV
ncbi:MAG: adenosylcobinamide-GDP ribazoletransferase, partial [Cyanobacteria bacterium SZAS LIN-2]|nr:adenosylcobinamide-GDP ribazoletransferase [Cyanobacteria bacterium SZAS LIN-2]